jgi:hypothetical protein
VLDDFEELALLPHEVRQALITELEDAIGHCRCGVKAGRVGLSAKAVAQQIFLSDVGRALERATGQLARRWSKRYDRGDGADPDAPESLYFRLVRELADAFDIALPKDLKRRAGKRAAKHQYGVMSSSMKTWQEAELATGDATARRNLEARETQGEIARQPPPTKPYAPPPVPERIEEQTHQEILAGKKRVAEHQTKAKRHRNRRELSASR